MGNLREFYFHESVACRSADDDTGESNGDEEHPVELPGGGVVRVVQDDEPQAPQREHEGGGQALHDVLAVHPVRHEGNLKRPLFSV